MDTKITIMHPLVFFQLPDEKKTTYEIDIEKQKRRLCSLQKEAKIAERHNSQELGRMNYLKRVCYRFLPPST